MLEGERNSIFERYKRWNKVNIMAQTGACFPSSPCMLQVTVSKKKEEYLICDVLCLKRFCQRALLRYSVVKIHLEAETPKKRCFLFSSCNYIEFAPTFRGTKMS